MALSDKLPPKILVIASDEALITTVANTVERGLFDVFRANSEKTAMKLAITNVPNIAIISSCLNNTTAIKMASKLRQVHKLANLPIMFLITSDELISDYDMQDNELVQVMYRPFAPFQLMSGIKSLLRKSQPIFQDKLLKYADISIDLATYKVFKGKENIHLGPTEFKILQLFMQSPRVIFSRPQIISYVWGDDKNIALRTVDVHVNRLRVLINSAQSKKASEVSGKNSHTKFVSTTRHNSEFIKTVRSGGYCLNLPGEIN